MDKVLGIDLGTTNSCVAILEHKQATILTNAEGGRTTPSVVAFLDDNEKVVGSAARRQAAVIPDKTITSIKRFIGRKSSEVEIEEKIVPYKISSGENDAVRVDIEGTIYSPEELSALILSKLKVDACAFLQEQEDEPLSVVITVPAYFNDAQRQATKQAAEIAGLQVLRLVNEPTAAALAYGFGQGHNERLLVFDLGGGTLDVSILEIGDNVFEVLSTHGDNHLGGDNFDQIIVDWLVAEFNKEKGIDLSADQTAMQRLYEAAEKAKIELSSVVKAQISLPFISASTTGPEHLNVTLSRSQLTELCSPLLERLVEPTQAALNEANEKGAAIDHIILVGGMTRMPAVRDKVETLTGKRPHQGVNPDEAVALGASIQAGVLQGDIDDVLLLDVIPLTLGIETKGGLMTKLIDNNTTIPVRVSEIFTTAEDNQPSVEIHVLQGERDMAVDNRSLGKVQLLGIPPAQAGVPQVEVTFDVNADGILNVTAKDIGTGKEKELIITAATGLDEDEVERLKGEALINQQRDSQMRYQAEVKVAAEMVCSQVEQQLDKNKDKMDDTEIEQFTIQLADLRELIEKEAATEKIDHAQQQLLLGLQQFAKRIYGSKIENDLPNMAIGKDDDNH